MQLVLSLKVHLDKEVYKLLMNIYIYAQNISSNFNSLYLQEIVVI